MSFFPTTDEERSGVLRSRLRSWKRSGLIDPEQDRMLTEKNRTRWTHSGLISRVIYFVLTLVCVAAIYGLMSLAGFPENVVTGVLCLAAAEVLILRFGLFRSGPDEALYLAGLFLLIFALPGHSTDEGIALFAAGLLLAGIRVRNGLFLTASIAVVILYLAVKMDRGEVAAFISLGVAFAALALLNREWRHPVWDRFFSFTVIVLPPLAYALVTFDKPIARNPVILGASIVAALLIVAAIAIRAHAPLISGLIVLGLGGYEAGQQIVVPVEAKLMLAGGLLGSAVLVFHRYLGGRTTGITADELLESHELTLLEPAAAAVLAGAQPRPTTAHEMQSGGGSYGGGGASGEF